MAIRRDRVFLGIDVRTTVLTTLLIAIFGGAATPSLAALPANDDFLSATRLTPGDKSVTDSPTTTDATTQTNVLGPARSGPAETTNCAGTTYGKTVWYLFRSPRRGVAELRADGFDLVVAVYDIDPVTSTLGALVGCADAATGSEDYFAPVKAGRSYAVQVGGADRGAGPASGALRFTLDVFGDLDGDGVLDELDRCPRRRGVQAAAGCPPRLNVTPALVWVASGSAVRLNSLVVMGVPRGAKVELRCRRGCALHEVKRGRGGAVRLRSASRRMLSAGASLELRVTAAASAGALYRYGAYGNYFRYDIRNGALHPTGRRCLLPGSRAPRKRCS